MASLVTRRRAITAVGAGALVGTAALAAALLRTTTSEQFAGPQGLGRIKATEVALPAGNKRATVSQGDLWVLVDPTEGNQLEVYRVAIPEGRVVASWRLGFGPGRRWWWPGLAVVDNTVWCALSAELIELDTTSGEVQAHQIPGAALVGSQRLSTGLDVSDQGVSVAVAGQSTVQTLDASRAWSSTPVSGVFEPYDSLLWTPQGLLTTTAAQGTALDPTSPPSAVGHEYLLGRISPTLSMAASPTQVVHWPAGEPPRVFDGALPWPTSRGNPMLVSADHFFSLEATPEKGQWVSCVDLRTGDTSRSRFPTQKQAKDSDLWNVALIHALAFGAGHLWIITGHGPDEEYVSVYSAPLGV